MKKKGNKNMPIPRQEVIDNPIPTSLFFNKRSCTHFNFCPQIASPVSTNNYIIIRNKQRCRDGVINDFLSRYRHVLVPLLFHEVTSLHPPSFQRNDFSTCTSTVLPDPELYIIVNGRPTKSNVVWRSLVNGELCQDCNKNIVVL